VDVAEKRRRSSSGNPGKKGNIFICPVIIITIIIMRSITVMIILSMIMFMRGAGR
jgi:hypothetical protein